MNIEIPNQPNNQEDFLFSEDHIESMVNTTMKESLDLLRSKTGTIMISNVDKYLQKLDEVVTQLEDMKKQAFSEKWGNDILGKKLEEVIGRVNIFDEKMEQFLRDYNS